MIKKALKSLIEPADVDTWAFRFAFIFLAEIFYKLWILANMPGDTFQ